MTDCSVTHEKLATCLCLHIAFSVFQVGTWLLRRKCSMLMVMFRKSKMKEDSLLPSLEILVKSVTAFSVAVLNSRLLFSTSPSLFLSYCFYASWLVSCRYCTRIGRKKSPAFLHILCHHDRRRRESHPWTRNSKHAFCWKEEGENSRISPRIRRIRVTIPFFQMCSIPSKGTVMMLRVTWGRARRNKKNDSFSCDSQEKKHQTQHKFERKSCGESKWLTKLRHRRKRGENDGGKEKEGEGDDDDMDDAMREGRTFCRGSIEKEPSKNGERVESSRDKRKGVRLLLVSSNCDFSEFSLSPQV